MANHLCNIRPFDLTPPYNCARLFPARNDARPLFPKEVPSKTPAGQLDGRPNLPYPGKSKSSSLMSGTRDGHGERDVMVHNSTLGRNGEASAGRNAWQQMVRGRGIVRSNNGEKKRYCCIHDAWMFLVDELGRG
jgi:hypothetical protein